MGGWGVDELFELVWENLYLHLLPRKMNLADVYLPMAVNPNVWRGVGAVKCVR